MQMKAMSHKIATSSVSRRITVGLAGIVAVATIVGLLVVWLSGVLGPPHGAYLAFASLSNIRNGLRSYDHLNGHLPPAAATNAEGESLYSWRVEVYQVRAREGFITAPEGNGSVSIDYDRRKAWNSAENLRLQAGGAWLFAYTQHGPFAKDNYSAYYKAITGPGTAFDPASPRSLEQLPNDLILVMRVEQSDTHWMEPGDLSIEHLMVSDKAKQLLLGEIGYAVLFADGRAWVLSGQLPFSDLRKFLTITGAQQYDRDKVLAPYRIL